MAWCLGAVASSPRQLSITVRGDEDVLIRNRRFYSFPDTYQPSLAIRWRPYNGMMTRPIKSSIMLTVRRASARSRPASLPRLRRSCVLPSLLPSHSANMASARWPSHHLHLPLLQPRECHHRKARQKGRRWQPLLQDMRPAISDVNQLPLGRRRRIFRLD